MDHHTQLKFQEVKAQLDTTFGSDLDLQSILFLIGVNELGIGYKEFSKSEKTDLLHVAICTILEPFGFYEFEGKDPDNWPHFRLIKELPPLNSREQEFLLKEAIIEYFHTNGYMKNEAESF